MNYERKVRATHEIELHLTDGQSNLRASATESRQPSIEQTVKAFRLSLPLFPELVDRW